jgi:hypothetical protein
LTDNELRGRADVGDHWAAEWLLKFLDVQGRIDELFAEVYAGTHGAGDHLIYVLAEEGQAKQAYGLRRFGLKPDGSIADSI